MTAAGFRWFYSVFPPSGVAGVSFLTGAVVGSIEVTAGFSATEAIADSSSGMGLSVFGVSLTGLLASAVTDSIPDIASDTAV